VNAFDRLATSIGAAALVALDERPSTILMLNSSTSRPKLTRQTKLDNMPMMKAKMPSHAMIREASGLVFSLVRKAGALGRISAREATVLRTKKSTERMRATR